MADAYKRLAGPVYLAATPTAVYTPSGGTTGIIVSCRCKNQDAVSRTVTVYQDGTNAAHEIVGPGVIPAGGTADDNAALIVPNGSTLYFACDAANKVTLVIYGLETS